MARGIRIPQYWRCGVRAGSYKSAWISSFSEIKKCYSRELHAPGQTHSYIQTLSAFVKYIRIKVHTRTQITYIHVHLSDVERRKILLTVNVFAHEQVSLSLSLSLSLSFSISLSLSLLTSSLLSLIKKYEHNEVLADKWDGIEIPPVQIVSIPIKSYSIVKLH